MSDLLILCTTDSLESAQKISTALLEAHEAACVNIISGVRSMYRWEGRICDEVEFVLLIKSSTEKFEEVRRRIRQLHTYQVPEIIGLSITAGDSEYLSWLRSSLQ